MQSESNSQFMMLSPFAAFLLPAGAFLFEHLKGAQADPFTQLSASIPDLLSTLFAGSSTGLDGGLPYLYSGLPVLMIAPFYFFSKKITVRKKITAGILPGVQDPEMVQKPESMKSI